MFCRNIISFIFIFGAAVIATVHNDPHSVTGSGPEVTDYHLTTENPESSTRDPEQQVTETAAVDLSALLDAGDGAVVTLVAGDTRLAAHRAVLVDRSPVFAAILERMTLEGSGAEVVIPDVEGAVLRQLLSYMYTLQAPQLPGMAPQLLAAADIYGLSSLKAHCEQQVAAQLSVETAAAAAVLAVKYSYSSLRQAAISFIKAHILHVMATRGWADAFRSHPEDMMKVIQLLFEAPVEARSLCADEKNRRLIEAAKEGAVEEVDALLAAGADLEAGDQDSRTALHWAAHEGHVEVARHLLAAGAEVEARNRWGETPLHWAAGKGHAAAARLLLEEASADPDASNQWRQTPLHVAAMYGRAEAVPALLQAGADRAAADDQCRTPLSIARSKNHQQLVDMLTTSS